MVLLFVLLHYYYTYIPLHNRYFGKHSLVSINLLLSFILYRESLANFFSRASSLCELRMSTPGSGVRGGTLESVQWRPLEVWNSGEGGHCIRNLRFSCPLPGEHCLPVFLVSALLDMVNIFLHGDFYRLWATSKVA